jgi:hypothetical protein
MEYMDEATTMVPDMFGTPWIHVPKRIHHSRRFQLEEEKKEEGCFCFYASSKKGHRHMGQIKWGSLRINQ